MTKWNTTMRPDDRRSVANWQSHKFSGRFLGILIVIMSVVGLR